MSLLELERLSIRLPTPDGLQDEVEALAGTYRDAQRAYAALGRGPRSGPARDELLAAVDEHERAITVRAAAAGLPACG